MTTPTDLLAHLTGTAAPAPATPPPLDLEAMLAKLPPDQAMLVRAAMATAPAQAAMSVPVPVPEPALNSAELKEREDEAVAAGKVKRTRKTKEQSETKEDPSLIGGLYRRDARLDVVIACIHSNRTPEDASAFLDLVGDA